jgi:hypothetical protein
MKQEPFRKWESVFLLTLHAAALTAASAMREAEYSGIRMNRDFFLILFGDGQRTHNKRMGRGRVAHPHL